MTGSSLDDSMTPPPAPAAAQKPNTFQRIAGVVMSPAATFEDIARRPDILLPLILFVAIGAVSTYLIIPRVDFAATYREAFESSNMKGEQLEKSVRMAAAVGKTFAYFGPVLQIIIFAIIAGVLLIVLFSLLGSLDIFTIWTIVLMIIGFAALSRLSRAKSAAMVISLWLMAVLFKVGGAAIGAARTRA